MANEIPTPRSGGSVAEDGSRATALGMLELVLRRARRDRRAEPGNATLVMIERRVAELIEELRALPADEP